MKPPNVAQCVISYSFIAAAGGSESVRHEPLTTTRHAPTSAPTTTCTRSSETLAARSSSGSPDPFAQKSDAISAGR